MILRRFPSYGIVRLISVALIFGIIPFVLSAGCLEQSGISNTATTACYATHLALNPSQPRAAYEPCLSPAQKKFPTRFLEFVDPNYPLRKHYPSENDVMYAYRFIPAENASRTFDISESTARMHRGEFLVQVDLRPTAPLHVIDPYATRVEATNTRDQCVLAWVGVDNLEKVASLPEVKQIWPISRAVVFMRGENVTTPQKKIDANILGTFEHRNSMIQNNELPVRDYNKTISVVIRIQPPSSVDVVDPYLTRITGHDQDYFRVYATVNLTETERIASLPEVAFINYNEGATVIFDEIPETYVLSPPDSGVPKQ